MYTKKVHPKDIYNIDSNSYVIGILDNDSKGLTGRGTKYWMTAVIDGELFQKEYTIMDILEELPIVLEINVIKNHYLRRQKEIEEQREREYQELKQLIKNNHRKS